MCLGPAGGAQKRRSEPLIHEREQKIKLYKGEKWYKLFLTAKAMDETLVSPPEPDPSDFSITKRAWTRALFKWKDDTKRIVDDLYAPVQLRIEPS